MPRDREKLGVRPMVGRFSLIGALQRPSQPLRQLFIGRGDDDLVF